MNDIRTIAEDRLLSALTASGARDPRDFYRERLRELKERDPSGYSQALEYYEKTLLPRVAEADSDPLAEWLEYGRVLASLTLSGETVQIDTTGKAYPYEKPVPLDYLVLHLPGSTREAALPVGIPPRLSASQRATYDLLVSRRVS